MTQAGFTDGPLNAGLGAPRRSRSENPPERTLPHRCRVPPAAYAATGPWSSQGVRTQPGTLSARVQAMISPSSRVSLNGGRLWLIQAAATIAACAFIGGTTAADVDARSGSGTPPSAGQPSIRANAARACGTFRMPGLRTSIRVRTRGPVSCATARRVLISLFNRKRPDVLGWRCIGPQTGYSICRRGGASVTGTF